MNYEELQKNYELGKIHVADLNDEQYDGLVNLYNEQIQSLKEEIAEKELKLNKNII